VKTCVQQDNQLVKKLAILSLVLTLSSALPGGNKKDSTVPPATHAKTYPACETHNDEKVSVAIDPFDTPEKASVFHTNFMQHGFLPVRVIISNDSDATLMLTDLKVEFITARRDKLQPATNDDLYRRLAGPVAGPNKPGVRLPRPLPTPKRTKPAVAPEVMAEIEAAQFLTVPVTAHSTYSGFLFFDVAGIDTPEAGAHIYLSGMKMDGKELFYFDIALEKYLSYQPGK
jgi:hypothetical protein